MNRKNLEILGLSEGATKDEITEAYQRLREKYLEERFKDGDVGNNAARMLNVIETAYNDLMNDYSEDAFSSGGDSFARVEELIKSGDLQEAQRALDNFNERGGLWHYYQSVLFYRKNWINESKKQLEIAIQLEPENDKYKEAYRKLNEKISSDAQRTAQGGQTVYEGQTMQSEPENQMGGNFCANCIECCYINLLVNCLCNACCR